MTWAFNLKISESALCDGERSSVRCGASYFGRRSSRASSVLARDWIYRLRAQYISNASDAVASGRLSLNPSSSSRGSTGINTPCRTGHESREESEESNGDPSLRRKKLSRAPR
jgi:hypothetical protein